MQQPVANRIIVNLLSTMAANKYLSEWLVKQLESCLIVSDKKWDRTKSSGMNETRRRGYCRRNARYTFCFAVA